MACVRACRGGGGGKGLIHPCAGCCEEEDGADLLERFPPLHHDDPSQYEKTKADKLDLVGEDQRRMLEYRKQVRMYAAERRRGQIDGQVVAWLCSLRPPRRVGGARMPLGPDVSCLFTRAPCTHPHNEQLDADRERRLARNRGEKVKKDKKKKSKKHKKESK